jgi:hypothetical protein
MLFGVFPELVLGHPISVDRIEGFDQFLERGELSPIELIGHVFLGEEG